MTADFFVGPVNHLVFAIFNSFPSTSTPADSLVFQPTMPLDYAGNLATLFNVQLANGQGIAGRITGFNAVPAVPDTSSGFLLSALSVATLAAFRSRIGKRTT